MSKSYDDVILELLRQSKYEPLKSKALARKLNVPQSDYAEFRRQLKEMARKGRIEVGKGNVVRLPTGRAELVGIYRGIRKGGGFVRPKAGQGLPVEDVFIRSKHAADAASGDLVLVHLRRARGRPGRANEGEVVEIIERATDRFVGAYRTAEGEGFVRVDGGIFHEEIYVGDANAKDARDGDKVVFEMLRFPSPEMLGEGVLIEVLGPRGEPGVDLLSVIRQFHLPDEFPEEVLVEAREIARAQQEQIVAPDRLDLTGATIVTVDPVDARDFDDAISLEQDPKGFWNLGIHIADVSTFVPQGSELDREARKRGTSAYLPGKVLPMFPEVISNGIASLQQGHVRYVKSVLVEFDPNGVMTDVRFTNSCIKVTKRLSYEAVMEVFDHPERDEGKLAPEVLALLGRMRLLAQMLRKRRRTRGLLELSMPKPELDYDDQGKIAGAHYAPDDESHHMIEEFMLTANEAVASKLADENIPFLRRIHEIPDPLKLKAFADFASALGITIDDYRSRFELQRVLDEVREKPFRHAIHYSLLRSLKMAIYGPEDEGHFGLASDCYCHFTSPIRRYPDLVTHRLLDKWIRTGKAGADHGALVALGEHCSFTERRAEKAERELVRIKLLEYLKDHVGEEMDMLITGVEEYGFFAQGIDLPAEGLVHIRTLTDDLYKLDRTTHTLSGRNRGKGYRLGDRVRCVLWRVDQLQRQLDLRVAETLPILPKRKMETKKSPPRAKRAGRKKKRR